MVTTRSAVVTPRHAPSSRVAHGRTGVVRAATRASPRIRPPTPVRRMSSEARSTGGGFIRRGGEWWRFLNPSRREVIVGLLSVLEPRGALHAWVCRWQPGFPFEGVGTPDGGRERRHPGKGSHDRQSGGWGRSSGRQRRRRYDCRQAPERAVGLVVRAQRLVQGRAGAPGEPQGTADGRAPHLHRHLARAPLARRRAAPRAHPADPLRALLRALRIRRRRRGPRPARRPPVALRLRGRPPLGRSPDRRPAQRVLPQRPHARPPGLPRLLPLPRRGTRPHRTDAALARPHPGRRRRAPRPSADARRPHRLSEAELNLLESTTAMFRTWDAQCGGGLRHKAVVGQLHEVTDLLQEAQPSTSPSASSPAPPNSPNSPAG